MIGLTQSRQAGDPFGALASRAVAQVATMGPLGRRLSILIYHRVLAEADPLFPAEIDASRFEQHLRWLKANFTLISLAEAVVHLRNDTLPARAACITFDDGYADNATIALPLLQHHGVAATVFVATGFLNGGRMWNDTVIELVRNAPSRIDLSAAGFGRYQLLTVADRQAAISSLINALKYLPMAERQAKVDELTALVPVRLRQDLMMTHDQVRLLHRAGIEIGAHTVHHPIIARLPDAAAQAEIANGKAALEAMIDAPVQTFAYPNGKPDQDYEARHVAMVKQLGFTAAVSTSWGAARTGSDLFQLPRFTPWNQRQLPFTLRMLNNLRSAGVAI